jgi:hypothetical protein
MKRRNVQMAFVGEGTTSSDAEGSVDALVEGDEAVDVDVTGGKLMVTVPAGTPDDQIFDGPSVLGGELVLENGVRLTFEIQQGATGAQFSAVRQEIGDDDSHQGLSSLPDVPGGA